MPRWLDGVELALQEPPGGEVYPVREPGEDKGDWYTRLVDWLEATQAAHAAKQQEEEQAQLQAKQAAKEARRAAVAARIKAAAARVQGGWAPCMQRNTVASLKC